ncbi:MAG TPA: hypothetical protein VIH90_07810, partial [Candidatus Saccharimonadales bacterium]
MSTILEAVDNLAVIGLISSATEAMTAAQISRGEIAVAAASLVFQQLPASHDSAVNFVATLTSAGLSEQAIRAVSTIPGIDGVTFVDSDFAHRPKWDNEVAVEEPLIRQTNDQTVLTNRQTMPEVSKKLYRKYEALRDAYRTGSTDLSELVVELNQQRISLGDDSFLVDLLFRDVAMTLVEDSLIEEAVFATIAIRDANTAAGPLIELAKQGYKPAIELADSRFQSEGVYAARHNYESETHFPHLKKTPELFSVAIEQGWLNIAGKIFDNVRNIDQLKALIEIALPILLDDQHFEVPELSNDSQVDDFVDEVLLTIRFGFDRKKARANMQKRFSPDDTWSTRRLDPADLHHRYKISNALLDDLAIGLAYRGRPNELGRIVDSMADSGNTSQARSLGRFASYAFFVADDIPRAIESYRVLREENPSDSWITREATIALARNGRVAESISMAARLYDQTKKPGLHSGFMLSLAVAGAHGV